MRRWLINVDMRGIKIYLWAISLISGILTLSARAALAQTGPLVKMKDKLQYIEKVFNQFGILGQSHDPQTALISYVIAIIKIFLGFLAILFVILIIYGGYLWMTAAGNEQRVEEAQNILKRAIIGVSIVLMAVVITNYIIVNLIEIAIK